MNAMVRALQVSASLGMLVLPALAAGLRPPLRADVTLPPGFSSEVIATGLSGATAMAVAPDGRIFICEQEGDLRVVKDGALLPRPFARLEVDSHWERGLIGVAVDPRFRENGLVYVCYVARRPFVHHRISRFTARGDAALEGSEVVLLEGDDQARLGGEVPGGHQGGALHFGADGKLYAAIGDQTAGAPAQALDSLLGKVLRLDADGSIPAGNPFHASARGKYRAIWALGCRNPFTFAIQPGSGRMFLNDVGGAREEVNEGRAGANFGWPAVEHGEERPGFTGPIHSYPVSSITGGDFLGPPPFRVLAVVPPAGSPCAAGAALEAVKDLAARNGFAVGEAAGGEAVTAEALRAAAAVVLLDPSAAALGPASRRAIEERVAGGGGLVIIHGALGAAADWPWLADAAGGVRAGGCSGSREETCRAVDRDHLSTAGLPEAWTWEDGWLEAAGGLAAGVRVLVSSGGGPVSWCREAGAGVVWVTALGHGREAWSRRILREHVLGGILYAARTVPSPVARSFPREYHGKYFFLDFAKGWIRVLDPDRPAKAVEFASGLPRPVDLRFAPDGSLLVLNRDMWVKDGAFRRGTGSLIRIRREGAAGAAPIPHARAAPREAAPPPVPFPAILPPSGRYSGPVHVRLRGAGDGEVRYEVGGALPGPASRPYERPFRLDASATVTARSFRDGRPSGPVATAVYEITGTRPHGLPFRDPPMGIEALLEEGRMPPLLSATGVFASLQGLEPAPGFIPYDVNAPLWSDGAEKRRWIALPGGETIGFSPRGEWSFPRGTVLVKHFEMALREAVRPPGQDRGRAPGQDRGRAIETRILVVTGPSSGHGVTYRWRSDGSDADLLEDGAEEEITVRTAGGPLVHTWRYPSREDCRTCHTRAAGFVLGPKTRQIHREFTYPSSGATDNQIRTWSYLGMLSEPVSDEDLPGLDRLSAIGDSSAPLEARVRSYLDANCANCHRPGMDIPAAFDARFDTSLAEAAIIGHPTVSDSLGIARPRVVAPGDAERSLLWRRMVLPERFKMPPLARNRVDDEAAAAVKEWIERLGRAGK
jgi:uncharacterized repeat protein (TIGR03806 family)